MSGLKPTNTNTQAVERDIDAGNGSTEQAQDLAALQSMAGGEALAEAEAQPVAVVPDLAGEIAGLVTAAVGMLGPVFPSLKDIYTPEATQAAAGAVAAVCQKHGWMQNGMLGEHGEEIACLFIVGPLAFATYKGVQVDIAARKPAQPEREPGALDFSAPRGVVMGQAPGANTVSMGVAA